MRHANRVSNGAVYFVRGAWAFAALLDDPFAAGLTFVATMFTGSETVPAVVALGSRARS